MWPARNSVDASWMSVPTSDRSAAELSLASKGRGVPVVALLLPYVRREGDVGVPERQVPAVRVDGAVDEPEADEQHAPVTRAEVELGTGQVDDDPALRLRDEDEPSVLCTARVTRWRGQRLAPAPR